MKDANRAIVMDGMRQAQQPDSSANLSDSFVHIALADLLVSDLLINDVQIHFERYFIIEETDSESPSIGGWLNYFHGGKQLASTRINLKPNKS